MVISTKQMLTVRVLLALGVISAFSVIWFIRNAGNLSGGNQTRADEQRMRDLVQIADLIERYHEVTGHYPLHDYVISEDDPPRAPDAPVHIEAIIAHRNVDDESDDRHADAMVGVGVLEEALSAGLGEAVTLPYDPESGAIANPYSYAYIDGNYFLSVHLFREHGLAYQLSRNSHKLQVSNIAAPERHIWMYSGVRAVILNEVKSPRIDE